MHEENAGTVYPEAVQSLFLDTASHRHVLALASESQTHVINDLPAFGDTGMIPALEGALKEVGWEFSDLTHIACVTGPGGFASIRTGITAANTLAYALKIPWAGVHVSDVWAARVKRSAISDQQAASFLWLHSTKKNLLFVRGFGKYAEKYPEPTLMELSEAIPLEGKYVGELLEEHQKALTGCSPISEGNITPFEEVLPSLLKNLSYGKEPLLPWYGREP